ncbi:MAG TPA: hypothetical protein VGI87_14825 [Solirubrobacteraceae bacterium]|jgi:hypothetical protein
MTSTHSINHARPTRLQSTPTGAAPRLRLLPSGDGWSLVTTEGKLMYSALGVSGRRRCLEFALAEGVAVLA